MTNRPAFWSWATRFGTHSGQIAPAVRNHCHSKLLRPTGASHSWVTFNLGRARFKQYCLLPTVIRQMSDETPPDNGSQLNCSAFDSRPMRLIVSQIDSRVSGSATEPDGLIDKHFELGKGQQVKAWAEYTRNFRANKCDLIRPRSCAEEPHRTAGCAGKRRRGDRIMRRREFISLAAQTR